MSENVSFFPLAAFGLTAFTLVTAVFVGTDFAEAADAPKHLDKSPETSCTCPYSSKKGSKPKLADLQIVLDESDEIAALQSVQYALTEVADGSTYVWHRRNGRISGFVKPVSSFKGTDGSICRQATIVWNSGYTTKKVDTKACRLTTGIWELEGSS